MQVGEFGRAEMLPCKDLFGADREASSVSSGQLRLDVLLTVSMSVGYNKWRSMSISFLSWGLVWPR